MRRLALAALACLLLAVPAAHAAQSGSGRLEFTSLTAATFSLDGSFTGDDARLARQTADSSYFGGNGDGQVSASEAETIRQALSGTLNGQGLEATLDENITFDGNRIAGASLQNLEMAGLVGPVSRTDAVTAHAQLLLTFQAGSGPQHTLSVRPRGGTNQFGDVEIRFVAPPGLYVTAITGEQGAPPSADAREASLKGGTGTITFGPKTDSISSSKASPAPDLTPLGAVLLAALLARRV